MLRERERTIASSATTTCLPTISGAASIRISLASLTSSAFKPILDAHASSKASAWNTLRSDTASAGLPPAVPAPETGAGCVNARCATAAGIARRSRGSIRLREPDANPLDRGESASRARATGSARVVGPGIGLCKAKRRENVEKETLKCRKLSSAFGATNARANYACESRRAGDFTKTLDVSTTHSCGITLRRWSRITPRSSRIQLSESGRARDYSVHCAKSQMRRTILNAHILP